jgi:hypothetical protein
MFWFSRMSLKDKLQSGYIIAEAERTVWPDDDRIERLLRSEFPWAEPSGVFLHNAFGTGPWPSQGWKLHVSATPDNAVDVLHSSLYVLQDAGVRFKVVSSLLQLMELNNGRHGITQVGKFITVYPSNDHQAVEVATSLAEATAGFRGPQVPSDRQLRPQSPVFYRYGAFRHSVPFGSAGLVVFDRHGRITPDRRLPYFEDSPSWPSDPFVNGGASFPDREIHGPFAGRYLIVGAMHRGIWGRVYDAIDLAATPPRRCVLKEFWHDVAPDIYGRDASDHAALEAAILATGTTVLPRLFEAFEHDDNTYLVLEHVDGETVADGFDVGLRSRHPLSGEEVVAIGKALAQAALDLHSCGIIHRDIKPNNAFITASDTARLIDVAFAYRLGVDIGPPLGCGTPGFMSPAQAVQEPPCFADDVFSWGATMHALATGDDVVTGGTNHVRSVQPRRPAGQARPDLPQWVCEIIDRATCPDKADRYLDFDEVRSELDGGRCESRKDRVSFSTRPARFPADTSWRQLAEVTAEVICDAAEPRQGGVAWAVRPEGSTEVLYSPNLYSGAAGIGIFLAAAASATGNETSARFAEATSRWLSSAEWGHGSTACGLYAGEAGIGKFYLQLASLLNEPSYTNMAIFRARRLAGVEPPTLDLVDGSAGLLIFIVDLAEATRDRAIEKWAITLGEGLIATAKDNPEHAGSLHWEIPVPMSGGKQRYLGLLHGVAGIGLSLLHLGVSLSRPKFVDAAFQVGEYLLGTAQISTLDGSTLYRWPRNVGEDRVRLSAHCHGAGGIGQFLVRLWRAGRDERFLSAARGAASTLKNAQDLEHSSLCHGIVGDGALFLDLYQATGNRDYLEAAQGVGHRLAKFSTDTVGVWKRTPDGEASPDFMTGSAGVGAFCLRLASPTKSSDLILPAVAPAS